MGQSTKLPHVALNTLTPAAARAALLHCCGSSRWVDLMTARRPFDSTPALFDAAREVWQGLGPEDRVEAFRQHPRLGESLSELARRDPRAARAAAREHAKLLQAGQETQGVLRELNERYVERFGYTFVVSAAGKSAQEIVALLRERLDNAVDRELDVAGEEQLKITALRLGQLA